MLVSIELIKLILYIPQDERLNENKILSKSSMSRRVGRNNRTWTNIFPYFSWSSISRIKTININCNVQLGFNIIHMDIA